MKYKVRKYILGIYDLFLSFGAVYTGTAMIASKRVFSEYPQEWLSKVPFTGWAVPGILAIVIFGFGNFIAALLSFFGNNGKTWFASAVMGGIFFVSLCASVLILGEWYLPTVQFFIYSIIQITLSMSIYFENKKSRMKNWMV
jgi:hypothetical protein